jgi:hypothetical protein
VSKSLHTTDPSVDGPVVVLGLQLQGYCSGNGAPDDCQMFPGGWIAGPTRELSVARLNFIRARGEAEEETMPVFILWAVPAVVVIGGVGYYVLRAAH